MPQLYRSRDGVCCAAAFCAAVAFGSIAMAGPVTEVGDAGDHPGSAYSTGVGSVPSITGLISSTTDADLYALFLPSPATFSATTVGTGTLGDTQLFLFDSAGLGVVANDDHPGGGTLLSTIPLGSVTGPAGLYYLAISRFDRDPSSAGGLIFPSGPPYTTVYGPTGPGGASPISSWGGTGDLGGYTIRLTDAEGSVGVVPLPGALSLGVVLLSTTGLVQRLRQKRCSARAGL
jgi:hypothetical protein